MACIAHKTMFAEKCPFFHPTGDIGELPVPTSKKIAKKLKTRLSPEQQKLSLKFAREIVQTTKNLIPQNDAHWQPEHSVWGFQGRSVPNEANVFVPKPNRHFRSLKRGESCFVSMVCIRIRTKS
jgi:hypothetical protein